MWDEIRDSFMWIIAVLMAIGVVLLMTLIATAPFWITAIVIIACVKYICS